MTNYKILITDDAYNGTEHIEWCEAETPEAAEKIVEERNPIADGVECVGLR